MSDRSEQQTGMQGSASPPCSLRVACEKVFGGVGALPVELFAAGVRRVAEMAGRDVDSDDFKADFKAVIISMPCDLD
jgi:hypothetical protein